MQDKSCLSRADSLYGRSMSSQITSIIAHAACTKSLLMTVGGGGGGEGEGEGEGGVGVRVTVRVRVSINKLGSTVALFERLIWVLADKDIPKNF